MTPEYKRGVEAAADVADHYNASTTHPYRLGDCILFKLNVSPRSRKKPRRNEQRLQKPKDALIVGMVLGALGMYRRLLGGSDAPGLCAVMRDANITLAVAKAAGVDPVNLRLLRKAGVPRK